MTTKTKTDPAQAIVDRIGELQAEIQPQRDKIEEILSAARAEADQVSAGIRETEEEIGRLELAAAALRGELPKPSAEHKSSGTRARRGSLPALTVDEAQVLKFISEQEEPVTAGQIREHFEIPKEISSKLSVLLGGLADTEQVKREGQKRSTKYSVA